MAAVPLRSFGGRNVAWGRCWNTMTCSSLSFIGRIILSCQYCSWARCSWSSGLYTRIAPTAPFMMAGKHFSYFLSPEQSHSSIDSRPPFHDCAEWVEASNSKILRAAALSRVRAGQTDREGGRERDRQRQERQRQRDGQGQRQTETETGAPGADRRRVGRCR